MKRGCVTASSTMRSMVLASDTAADLSISAAATDGATTLVSSLDVWTTITCCKGVLGEAGRTQALLFS